MPAPRSLAALLAAMALLVAVEPAAAKPVERGSNAPQIRSTPVPSVQTLADRIIILDPGHQLGDRHFPAEMAETVDAADPTAPWATTRCGEVGVETDQGVHEATVTWRVASLVHARLRADGARVLLTRDSNTDDEWGPCVDERGRLGNDLGADLRISIHAGRHLDGGAVGFRVVAPGEGHPASALSGAFAEVVRDALLAEGVPAATHVGTDGLDVRSDLATLNHSEDPAVLVELGNLRAAEDAERLTSPAWQARYVDALTCAVLAQLGGAPGC